MSLRYQGFVFDLDGTILSTLEDIADAVNHSLRLHGFPTHDYSEYPAFLGNGSVLLIKRALGEKSLDHFQEVFDTYYQYYHEHYCVKTHPFKGLPEVLKKAKEKGVRLFVYTNKPDAIAQEVVTRCYGKNLFEKVVGIPLGGKVKPDPEAFRKKVIEPCSFDPNDLAYFGDSVTDILTARNLQIPNMFSVSWGYVKKEILAANHPTRILDKVEEILALL